MARALISAAVGIGVGFLTGNPYAGVQAGLLVYGLTGFLDPREQIQGPRLQDLKAPQADLGAPVAYLRGAPRLAGNIIWASPKREIATTQNEGKGGPGVASTTYTYEMDMGIRLSVNPGYSLRRIFSNGRLVASVGDDADATTLDASGTPFVDIANAFVEFGPPATNDWKALRFYGGTLTQLPDPTYEALVGVGNAPAHRGSATVVVESLNLGNSGQVPLLTFEVAMEPFEPVYLTTQGGSASNGNPNAGSGLVGTPSFASEDFTAHIPQWDAGGGTTDVDVWDMTATPPDILSTYLIPTVSVSALVMLGNSDVSCLVYRDAVTGAGNAYLLDGNGAQTLFAFGVSGGTSRDRFARLDADIVFASSDVSTGDKKVYRASILGGSAIAVSAVLAQACQCIAISSDGFVYVLSADGSSIYVLDLPTLTLQATIAKPTTTETGFSVLCDGPTLYLRGGLGFWLWNGSSWETIVATLPAGLAQQGGVQCAAVINGSLFNLSRSPTSPPFSFTVWTYRPTVPANSAPLDQVVSDLCIYTGQLTTGDIDVTELASDNVRALAITQVGPVRTTIEQTLAPAFFFEAAEADKLRFVKRGGSIVATIPYSDLGASADGTTEPLPKKRVNDMEQAALVTISYANVLADFQTGAETSDRLITESTAVTVVQLPLGMTPSEAKKVADVNTMDLAVALLQIGPIQLPRKYSALECTDPVLITNVDGSTFRARIVQDATGSGIKTLQLILDDETVINSSAATDSTYSSSTLVRKLSATVLALLDIPILRDADNAPGFYAAFGASGAWPGAELDKSIDGTSYTKVLDVIDAGVIGAAGVALGNFTGGNCYDEKNSLTVTVGGATLSSVSRADLVASSDNALLVGAEIIQFRSASLLSSGPNVYLLTGLLRGRRGTEWAIAGHAAKERVVVLQASGIRRVAEQQGDVGVAADWKAVTYGASKSTAAVQSFTDTGVGQKPFAPVDLHVVNTGAQQTLEWHRRSRLSGRLFSTSGDPPLGETTESYDVELRDPSNIIVGSDRVSTPQWALQGGLFGGAYLAVPVRAMRVVSSEIVAIRDDAAGQFSNSAVVALNETTGALLETSQLIGQVPIQLANNGTSIYVAATQLAPTPGLPLLSTKVFKFTLGTLATTDATYTAGTVGDITGLAHDGTNPWTSEYSSGQLRKLDPSSLVSLNTYALTGQPSCLFYLSAKLWVGCYNGDVVRWDIASHTEEARFSIIADVGAVIDVYANGSIFVAYGTSAVATYNASTGALLDSVVLSGNIIYAPQQGMAPFGSSIAVTVSTGGQRLVILADATTGLFGARYLSPTFYTFYVAGSIGSDLYLTGGATSGINAQTRIYEVAPPNLSGYSVTVYQNSSAVGRGYPATLEL